MCQNMKICVLGNDYDYMFINLYRHNPHSWAHWRKETGTAELLSEMPNAGLTASSHGYGTSYYVIG